MYGKKKALEPVQSLPQAEAGENARPAVYGGCPVRCTRWQAHDKGSFSSFQKTKRRRGYRASPWLESEVLGFFHVGELHPLWENAAGKGANNVRLRQGADPMPIWSPILALFLVPNRATR